MFVTALVIQYEHDHKRIYGQEAELNTATASPTGESGAELWRQRMAIGRFRRFVPHWLVLSTSVTRSCFFRQKVLQDGADRKYSLVRQLDFTPS